MKTQELKLVRIVENLQNIPTNGFAEQKKKLSPQEKKQLIGMLQEFETHATALRLEDKIAEVAKVFNSISTLAETYALNEAGDWFQGETVKRDFKDLKGRNDAFQKLAKECYGRLTQMNALTEDIHHVIARYFDTTKKPAVTETVTSTGAGQPTPQQEDIINQLVKKGFTVDSTEQFAGENAPTIFLSKKQGTSSRYAEVGPDALVNGKPIERFKL